MIFKGLNRMWFFCGVLVLLGSSGVKTKENRTNVVFIIADDLGWDDVSFHGSDQVLTPNIDLLAYTGVALGKYYSHCVCTPSRSALLTGKYAHTIGMQGYPLTNSEDRGLPITEKILPQYLKERGYATHLVGKWHVGHSRAEYLPTNRGFDSHYGHRGGYLDYYEYNLQETWTTEKVSGFDLYRNMSADWGAEGYLTDLYNEEAKSIIKNHDIRTPLFLMVGHNAPHSGNEGAVLQAPPEEVRAMRHLESPQRRIYSAMVKKLDDSVGEIVKALYEKGILNDTVIVFTSDNGGITSGDSVNYASNWPLRGTKMSPFEGGIKVTGLAWSTKLNYSDHLWNGFMHISDWLPTLIRAAGFEPPKDIDGVDQWNAMLENKISDRTESFEIDDVTGFASIISNDYKLIIGTATSEYCDYHGEDLRGFTSSGPSYVLALESSHVYSVLKEIGKPFNMESTNLRNNIKVNCNQEREAGNDCYPKNGSVCLFNITADPCEMKDIAAENPEIVSRLLAQIEIEIKRMKPRVLPIIRDPRSTPSLHNFTWTNYIS